MKNLADLADKAALEHQLESLDVDLTGKIDDDELWRTLFVVRCYVFERRLGGIFRMVWQTRARCVCCWFGRKKVYWVVGSRSKRRIGLRYVLEREDDLRLQNSSMFLRCRL